MSRKPQPPPQTTSWAIYRAVHRAAWLGTVEAVDEADAIEKAAESRQHWARLPGRVPWRGRRRRRTTGRETSGGSIRSKRAAYERSGSLRATVPHGCNPVSNAEFDSQRLGCSE